MSIRGGVVVNLLVQVYAAVVGVLVLPIYLKRMGAEAYGLVGLYVVLQSWAAVLDMGLSPMLTRELARFKAGAVLAIDAAKIVRTLEWFFGLMALASVFVAVAGKDWVATHWLSANSLPAADTAYCIAIMGAMIGLRWLVGVYRSSLIGLDKLVAIGLINALITTIRTFGVLVVLAYVSSAPAVFFECQLFVAVFELIILAAIIYGSIPMRGAGVFPGWKNNFRGRLGFAGGMAYLALVWAVIMQIDKLALSHWLSLKEYGYFSMAISIAGGVMLFSIAFVQSLQPRITMLIARQDSKGALRLFRLTIQFVTAGVMSLAAVLAFQGQIALFVWTQNEQLAQSASGPLGFYAMGNAVYAISGVTFVLQFAHGKTEPHARAITKFSLIWVPALLLAAYLMGGNGSGAVWFVGNLWFLFIWMAKINNQLIPELSRYWIVEDFLVVALASFAFPAFVSIAGFSWHGRLASVMALAGLVGISFLAGLLVGSQTRTTFLTYFRRNLFW